MTPERIRRLRTHAIRFLVGDCGLSAILWGAYLADIADGHELTLLGGATTTSVLAGLGVVAVVVLTGQAILCATLTEAEYWRGYEDCATDKPPRTLRKDD